MSVKQLAEGVAHLKKAVAKFEGYLADEKDKPAVVPAEVPVAVVEAEQPQPQSNTENAEEAEADADAKQVRELFDKYNELAVTIGLRKADRLTKKRRASARARIREGYLKRWDEIAHAISISEWHRGVNDSGWVADFNWFLQPDKVWTLVEKSKPVEIAQQPEPEDSVPFAEQYVEALCEDGEWHRISMADLRHADCLDVNGATCLPVEDLDYRTVTESP